MFIGLMSITHIAIAAAGTSLILGTAAPLPLGFRHIDRPSNLRNLSSQWWGHNSESQSESRLKGWHRQNLQSERKY